MKNKNELNDIYHLLLEAFDPLSLEHFYSLIGFLRSINYNEETLFLSKEEYYSLLDNLFNKIVSQVPTKNEIYQYCFSEPSRECLQLGDI